MTWERIKHRFTSNGRGLCIYPVKVGDHYKPCMKMAVLHG